jgi:hypothetical protein
MAKRVYFAFHYDDVKSFRANVVRKHDITKEDREDAGFFDASIWEESRKKGDIALKRLINGGLDNTTATAVLIGSDTYSRRWVRYEIMKSLQRGNKLIGIHINGIKDKDKTVKTSGPNPFEYLGYKYSDDGNTLYLYEWKNGQWTNYSDIDSYNIKQVDPIYRGQFVQLSKKKSVYDWIKDDGYNNFADWI